VLAGTVALTLIAGGVAAARQPGPVSGFGEVDRALPPAAGAASDAPVLRAADGRSTAPPQARAASRKAKAVRQAGRQQIWFRPPVDFATGAVPSSEAFNAAQGDQLIPLTTGHAALSDSVGVGDFNGDGKPDVAQTNVVAGSVSVFLGRGGGDFAKAVTHPVGVHPNHIAVGDLDLDARLDLVVANVGSNELTILRGTGDGGFGAASLVPVPRPQNVAIGRFNADDIPDLVVASGAPSAGCPVACAVSPAGGTAVLTGAKSAGGALTYTPMQLITHSHSGTGRPVSANYVAVGDFDGSGRDDLAVGVGTNRSAGGKHPLDPGLTGDDLLVFLNRNDAGQPFRSAPDQEPIRVGGSPDAIAVADWNADDHPDLAVLHNGSGDVTSLLGDSAGRFTVRAVNVSVGATPRSLTVGDFDDDGAHDLVTASFGASTISVLRGNRDGTFQPAVDFWSGEAPTSVAAGQFDHDGRLDVVVGRLRLDKLSLLINDSPHRGDGVEIRRNIPYGIAAQPTDERVAHRHTLDVYIPPPGAQTFAGRGRPNPVAFFVHGGQGISGDKSAVSFLMRSLAAQGIVAVSVNYRLGFGMTADQVKDVAQAFRWTRDHVGSNDIGGDPANLFLFGHSGGAGLLATFATDPAYSEEQKSVRGLIFVSGGGAAEGMRSRGPSLLMSGTEGLEVLGATLAASFAGASAAAGADSEYIAIPGRDHWTVLARMALADDEARGHQLSFMRKHLR
jgi:hypothetical protein